MTKAYKTNPVERFMEVLTHSHLPPAIKAKTLTAIAYSMSLNEIEETRAAIAERLGSRLKRLQELEAPTVIIDLQKDLTRRHNAYLDRAEKRLIAEGAKN